MNLKELESWKRQAWTQVYEAALFELDQAKLAALIWEAQAAIHKRELQLSDGDAEETSALQKAKRVLGDLREITFFQDGSPTPRRPAGLRRAS